MTIDSSVRTLLQADRDIAAAQLVIEEARLTELQTQTADQAAVTDAARALVDSIDAALVEE